MKIPITKITDINLINRIKKMNHHKLIWNEDKKEYYVSGTYGFFDIDDMPENELFCVFTRTIYNLKISSMRKDYYYVVCENTEVHYYNVSHEISAAFDREFHKTFEKISSYKQTLDFLSL